MRLKSVTLRHFKVLRKKQTIKLPSEPGLYLVRGDNKENCALGSNDCGKTSFGDAIHWGLFGTTTRGLRASDVVSFGKTSAMVEQVWDIAGKEVVVRREQNPNGILLNGKRVEQSKVQRALGINDTEFGHSLWMGQFSDLFMDLGPSDKLGLFSSILDLDYWEQRSADASERTAEYGSKADGLASKLERIAGKLESLREQRDGISEKYDAWKAKNEAESRKCKREIKVISQKYAMLRGQLCESVRLREAAESSVDRRANLADIIGTDVSGLDREIDRIRKCLKVNHCPFCDRKMDERWKNKLNSQLDHVIGQHKELSSKLVVALARLKTANAEYDDARQDASELTNEIALLTTDLRRLKERREAINPYESTLDSMRGDIRDTNMDRRKQDARHAKALTMQNRYKYWVKGFRDLRLWILDTALSEVSMRVNSSMLQLGLADDWTVKFVVERENRSGGVTRGFISNVYNKGSSEPIPWRSLGGGVTQRIRVAAQIGLAQMIMDRHGISAGIEVWDEPTMFLSPQGVQDLMQHMQDRAHEEQKVILVIDHRSLDYPFDGELLFIRGKGGSHVETSY